MAPSIAKDALGSGSSLSPATKSTSLNAFETLVSDLSRILGPSSGLDSSEVDVKQLQKLMEDYVSSEKDWEKYAFEDLSRGYTRNLVDEGNGKSNLVSVICHVTSPHFALESTYIECATNYGQLILVWTPNKGSPVHDHADAHCLMKILKGTLKETRFDFPRNNATAPQVIKEIVYQQGEVTYMADELGLHKISNPDEGEIAVSLHREYLVI